MPDFYLLIIFAVVALVVGALIFSPSSRGSAQRAAKATLYGTALVAIVVWTLLKALFIMAGRRLLGH